MSDVLAMLKQWFVATYDVDGQAPELVSRISSDMEALSGQRLFTEN